MENLKGKNCYSDFHRSCHQQLLQDGFLVLKPDSLNNALLDDDLGVEQEDMDRFKVARDGDHLITPFQCDLYHDHNIQKIGPILNSTDDELFFLCIRRDNLYSL